MEIRHLPYPLSIQPVTRNAVALLEGPSPEAQSQSGSKLAEYISHGELLEEKTDYRELIRAARQQAVPTAPRHPLHPGKVTAYTSRALSAYQEHSSTTPSADEHPRLSERV